MEHSFEFFDRQFFDPIWSLSWGAFQKLNGTRWATSKSYDPGAYAGQSLRGLICFNLSQVPSPEALEDILARRTVRWTIRHSNSQFYFISELMQEIPGHRTKRCEVVDADITVPISAATGAYLAGKIDARTFRAVLKLCGSDPQECVQLTRKQRGILAEVTSNIEFWRPIYAWQGANACTDEDATSCLDIADTRRFVACIAHAWSENWPVMKLKDPDEEGAYFRDFTDAQDFQKAIGKIRRFVKPSAFRQ
jgi:hypothetical protein